MTKNIFKGAKFGDKFVCKNGEIALFTRHDTLYDYDGVFVKDIVWLYTISNGETSYSLDGFYVDDNGFCDKTEYDSIIVSRYQEAIDEEKLNKLAFESIPEYCYEPASDYMCVTWEEAYKAGYRKAEEG